VWGVWACALAGFLALALLAGCASLAVTRCDTVEVATGSIRALLPGGATSALRGDHPAGGGPPGLRGLAELARPRRGAGS